MLWKLFAFPFWVAGWMLISLLRVGIWLGLIPLRSALGGIKLSLAVIAEEVKRWFGLASWGFAMLYAFPPLVRVYPPVGPYLVLPMVLWLYVVFRSLHQTIWLRVARVKQRQMYQKIDTMTSTLPGQVQAAIAGAPGREDVIKIIERARSLPDNGVQADFDAIANAANTDLEESLGSTVTVKLSGPNPVRPDFEPVFWGKIKRWGLVRKGQSAAKKGANAAK